MSLDEAIQKLAEGDDSGFETLYLATKKMTYHIALGILGEGALAEDAMQTAYMKVIANAGRYRQGSNALAWIARIVRNEALNMRKMRMRELSVDEQQEHALFGEARPDDYGLFTDVARRTLPAEEFTVLMLVAVDGYRRREIAEMLGIPTATVTWRYHRALAGMRRALKGEKE